MNPDNYRIDDYGDEIWITELTSGEYLGVFTAEHSNDLEDIRDLIREDKEKVLGSFFN